MTTQQMLKAVGVVLVCLGVHLGVGALLPVIVFGVGLALLVLL